MSKFGSNQIGKMFFGSNSIGKAYYGSNLVFQKGGGGGGGGAPVRRLQYFDTDATNYILAPVTYSSANTYEINLDIQFLGTTANFGTGWNAGGALAVYERYYGNGASYLSPRISCEYRVDATIQIGTSGYTTVSAVYGGTASSHNRANSSLATYAGSTGFPIGCMTNTGGAVPSFALAMRIYSVQILKNGVTEFDAYPAVSTDIIINDRGVSVPVGTVGLYDTVTDTFFTNRGSGNDFTPGPYYQ